jgi:GntR family transcriptional regulator, rspAB operon transcriptional repressor
LYTTRSPAHIAAALRERILGAELAAGAELRQDELAADLGVSRTPLREALRLLEGEGLVESSPHRPVVVAPLSADDLEQVYAMRIVLEATAVRMTAPRMEAADLAVLHGLLAEMAFHAERRDTPAWEAPHERFHNLLVSGAGSSYGERVGSLSLASRRYRRAYLGTRAVGWERGAAEHAAIAEACASGDGAEAAALLGAHLAGTALALLEEIDPGRRPELLATALGAVPGSSVHLSAPIVEVSG